MTINKKQSDKMLELAKPLIKWLNKFHPHVECTVTCYSVELKEGISKNTTDEFIID